MVHPKNKEVEAIIKTVNAARAQGHRITSVRLSKKFSEMLVRQPNLANKLSGLPLDTKPSGEIVPPHVAVLHLSNQLSVQVNPAASICQLDLRSNLTAEDSFANLLRDLQALSVDIDCIYLPRKLYDIICSSPRRSGGSFVVDIEGTGRVYGTIVFDGQQVSVGYERLEAK
jgi:hypothetical protein